MKKLASAFLLVLFLGGFSFAQEEGKNPMYYKGVDAGMSPEETVKTLGKPTFSKEQDGKILHFYRLENDSSVSLHFHKKQWLYRIAFNFRPPVHFKEFGLT